MKALRPFFALCLGASFAVTGCFFDADDDEDDGADACVTSCEDSHADCVVDCDDDTCVAACDTDLESCETECT